MTYKYENPGLQKSIIKTVGRRIKNKKEIYQNYILLFDEMSIKSHLIHNVKNDVGFKDTGVIMGRTQYVAKQLLVLMFRVVSGKKKMPIGFYFEKVN